MLWAVAAAVAAVSMLGVGVSAAYAARKPQTIAFTSSAPKAATVGGPTYHPTAEATSKLPVTLTIDAASSAVCTISGSTVSFIAAGTCTIDANQPGNGEQPGSGEYEEPPFYGPAATVRQSVAVTAAPLPANSSFRAGAKSFDAATGRVIFTEIITDPGTFTWRITVPNGKFGAFASRSKCKVGFLRLRGKCRPSKIVFSSGTATVPPGVVIFKLRPSASALKMLKAALKQKKGVLVTATFTFQSSRGGSPVSHTQTLADKLKKK
jgi:hypothetical protein